MQIVESDFNLYQILELWHWDYGPFCSEDGFKTEAEARADAEQFIGSFTEAEWREAEEEYQREKAAMAEEGD